MAVPSALRGRFFADLIVKAMEFYARHRQTIDPVLSSAAIAALSAVLDVLTELASINKPGPG